MANQENAHYSTATAATVAGVAGAIIGAAATVAATQLLKDKKTRDKLKGALTNMRDQFGQTAEVGTKGGKAVKKSKKSKTTIKAKTEKNGQMMEAAPSVGA